MRHLVKTTKLSELHEAGGDVRALGAGPLLNLMVDARQGRAGHRRALRNRVMLSILPALLLPAIPAKAEKPSVVIATAPLVSPVAALAYYGSPASPAPPTTRDPLIQEQARALRYNVDQIYAFLRDNIETTSIFGVQEGARGVVLNHRGTPFDQAQFMVEALREADAVQATGYNPKYIVGQITISAADFSSWFGVNDAALASRMLGASGIPATVTGSGSSFTVTMLHIWVQVTIGSTQYVFDPSFKKYTDRDGIGWQPSVGYNQATLLASGGGGTATTVSSFNATGFRSTLDGYRAGVETTLASGARGKRADAVVGSRDIIAHTAAEDRRTSLPYATTSDRVWTGQIPDSFRASIAVSLNGSSYGTYFADAVGGQALGFSYTYNATTNVFGAFTGPGAVPQILGDTLYDCDQYLGSQPAAAAPAVAAIVINHPYAANGGTYADRVLSKQIVAQRCDGGITDGGRFYVTNDWGYTGPGIADRIKLPAARARTDPVNRLTMTFGPTLANVAAQYSRLLDLGGFTQGNIYFIHDLIGLHTLDSVSNKLDLPETYDPAAMLTMDFEGAVTALSPVGTTASDTSAAFTAGLGLSFVEGSVPRQESDAVYDMSALKLLTEQNIRATPAGNYATYLATPATWPSVKNNLSSDYSAAAITAMQGYIEEGYSLLIPQHGGLREPPITIASSVTRTMSLWEGRNLNGDGGEYKRSTFMAWRPASGTNTVPDRVALLVYDPRHSRVLKAGVGVSIDSISGTIRKPEAPKAESKDAIRAAITIDGQSGSLKYSPPADLVDGTGDFPFSLSLRRSYDQREGENYGLGIGWKSNWNHLVTLSNDGNSALGGGGAQALGSALVALTAIGDLAATPDAVHLHAAAQVASWFSDQTINNAAVVTSGLDGEQTFYRQSNGTLANAKADGTSLTQTGSPTIGIINRRLYDGLSFAMIDRDGATRDYSYKDSPSGLDLSSPAIASLYSAKSLQLDNWRFPNGVNVTATYYSTVAVSDIVGLNTVSNNLGASITNSFYDYGAVRRFPTCTAPFAEVTWVPPRPASIKYRTSAGAEVSISMEAQSLTTYTGDPDLASCDKNSHLVGLVIRNSVVQSFANRATDAVGSPWSYIMGNSSGLYGGYRALTAIYKPSAPTVADIIATQGLDYNVRSLADAGGNIWSYFSNFYRSEVLSPAQAGSTAKVGDVAIFDRYGQPVRAIDALQRETVSVYDDLGRVIQSIRPAGDSVLTDYDARGNVIQSSRRPVGGTGSTDIVTSTSYVVGPTIVTCSPPAATCNKPATATDGRGQVTNYAWNADGTLASVMLPADRIGTRPQTTLSYSTTLNGTDGTSLHLLTGKTELISSGVSTTTTYTRDPSNKFSVSAAMVDPSGLNLRTCTKFDAAGNLISLSDPRQVTCP